MGQKTKNRSTQENSEDKDKDDNNKKSRFCQRFKVGICYVSRLKGLSQEATLVLSNTRELDRVPKTK